MSLSAGKRIVIKIGSSLLVDAGTNRIKEEWLKSVLHDVSHLWKDGKDILIVSSGAIPLGRRHLQFPHRNLFLDEKQAAASVGQIQLAHAYQSILSDHRITAAQILLTLEDSEDRKRYLNARNTLETLLKLRTVPIINENDTIATAEIRYGDNDRLAARVAQMVSADTLVLLSDIDGLYTANPQIDQNAVLIREVTALTPEILNMAGDSNTNFGSGGMITKLAAAKIALSSGCRMVIASGKHNNPLARIEQNPDHTWFLPSIAPISARKNWILQHLKIRGTITIDDGAVIALREGKSLLSAGITHSAGEFDEGDAVSVLNANAQEIARGLVCFNHQELLKIRGKHSQLFETILGYNASSEVIHRDDLVLVV